MSHPSKKEFANMINQVLGRPAMTEEKLDQILFSAKKAYKQQGIDGFYSYMRDLLQAPIANKDMKNLMTQVQNPKQFERLRNTIESVGTKQSKSRKPL